MVLPFFQGLLFFGEGITWAKGISVLFICLALGSTIEKGEKKKGTLFYVGVFLLNGLVGVVSKLYTESDQPKISAAGYSVWIAIFTAVLAGGIWWVLTVRERRNGQTAPNVDSKTLWTAYGVGALYGVFNRIGNFLLVAALVWVDASVQYPMVTGGTMIVSTLISCLGEQKPNGRELLSVALAFAGMLLLFLVPL